MEQVLEKPLVDERGIEAKLRRAWRKERRYLHLRGLCYFLVWLGALGAVTFLVDRFFQVPISGRLVLLAGDLSALAWVLWRHWWQGLYRFDPLRMALRVEKHYPELRTLLVSYVELRGELPEWRGVSEHLLEAMRQQAVETTRPIDFKQILSYAELKRILIVSACVVVFAAAVSVNWPEHMRIFLARMLGANAEYPTRTHLAGMEDLVIKQGESVTVTIQASGMVPAEGTIFVAPAGGRPDKGRMLLRQAGNTFVYQFQDVYQSFSYSVKIGDARSRTYNVTVVPPPVTTAKLKLHYPQYIKWADKETDQLNIEVPEGTDVGMELSCQPAVNGAQIIFGERPDEQRAEKMEVRGAAVRSTFSATQPTAYRFAWQWSEHGKQFSHREEGRHFIQIIPDLAPSVEILQPDTDIKATVQKTARLQWQAKDDYGIARAKLVWWLNNGDENSIELNPATSEFKWRLSDSARMLKPGDRFSFYIEVADGWPGAVGGHPNRSSTRTIEIVDILEYQQWILGKVGLVLDDLRAVDRDETDASGQVKLLKGDSTQPAPATTRRGEGDRP